MAVDLRPAPRSGFRSALGTRPSPRVGGPSDGRSMAETPPWQFQLIGPMTIKDPEGRDVTPRGRKVQAMLGVLALAGNAPVTRARLAGMLWGDVPERQARESLRQALYQLTADLGAHAPSLLDRAAVRDALRVNAAAILSDVGLFFDTANVPDGHAILQACNGALLDGLDGISIEFDQWLLAERARFETRLREILEGEIKRLQSTEASVDELIWAAERLLRFDQASELATRVLMTALVKKGDRAAALRAYRRCEDALRQRLDVAPSRELRALAEAVRHAATAPIVSGGAVVKVPPAALVPAARGEVGLTPVIGFIPLKSRIADPAHDVIGEVVAEEAIAQLSASGRMRVISRLSTTAVRHERKRVDEIGRVLGANFIASGSYHVAGDQVQAMIELADVRTQEVVWSERVRGAIADVLAPESPFVERICAEIAGAVADLERRRIHRLPLPTLEAFSLQLAGSTMMHQASVAEFKRSREVLEHLVERHPDA
ncbi:MAG: hypothetical protein FJX57_19230, partial [Alphaproteobacteria bacterium]|nr:hypothetical protein [Alphaproteobacteria bacterium]